MKRIHFLLLATILIFTACTSTQQYIQPAADDTLQHDASILLADGDYLQAAQLYMDAAQTAPLASRVDLLLKAADYLAQGAHWDQLNTLLSTLDPQQLTPSQNAYFQLISAELAIGRRQADRAQEHLQGIEQPEAFADNGLRYHRLRAQAYALAGNALEAARQLIWLDGLIDDPEPRLENQYRIWEQLSRLSEVSLTQLLTSPPPDPLSGWMELMLITRQARGNQQRWNQELDAWQSRYPQHAATTVLLPELRQRSSVLPSQSAGRIAVLLPLSGRAGDSAAAIRDGIMAAYYTDSDYLPELRFYDTGDNSQMLRPIYQQAISEGAEFVIGPLMKDSIQELARSTQLPAPTLALNQAEIDDTLDLPLYRFGLTPEDEASQAAEKIVSDGHRRVIAFAPENAWGERVLDAFTTHLADLGGELLAISYYTPGSSDFKTPIQSALNLDASKSRHRALQRLLGQKLNYEPRRRQDTDAIFLLGFPKQARLIMPQLRFHHAGDIPVYSTSHVFSAHADARLDRDMDGLYFCDIPWVLDTEGPWAMERERSQRVWPQRSERYQRLFALGFDAYQVIPWLGALSTPGFAFYPGATGILTLEADKTLHRGLDWAQFRNGLPRKIMPTEGQYEPQSHRGSGGTPRVQLSAAPRPAVVDEELPLPQR